MKKLIEVALERLTFLEPGGKVGYRYGERGAEQVALMAAEESGEYFYRPHMLFGLDFRIFRCH